MVFVYIYHKIKPVNMKKLNLIICAFGLLLMLACKSTPQTTESRIDLYNGTDLSNWDFYLADDSYDPSSVFMSHGDYIHITGEPFGYMRTKDTYSDYILNLEWRWPLEGTNSGVFIHANLPDSIWPLCFEVQLRSGRAGDFVCMSGSTMNEQVDSTRIVVNKFEDSSEFPVGEWNSMQVKCINDSIVVHINGVLQNKGTGISHTSGHICLQSEGKDIEFRNVYLTLAEE